MPGMARVVVPGYPRHVTQRGNRRQAAFFRDDDWSTSLSFAPPATTQERAWLPTG